MEHANEYVKNVEERIAPAFLDRGPRLRWAWSVLWRTRTAVGLMESRRLYPTEKAARRAQTGWINRSLPADAKEVEE